MDALRTGLVSGVKSFRQDALAPTGLNLDWDSFDARIQRYVHARHYYHNTAYSKVQAYATQFITDKDLYKYTRPIYNPVFRLVEAYVALVWGGNLDMKTLTAGAIPLEGLDGPDGLLTTAIRQLWIWSNWQFKKAEFVRTGAMLGDVLVKVVNDLERRKAYFEVQNPDTVYEVAFDAMGNVKAIHYAYYEKDTDTERLYLREEIIDNERFRTFRDGQPFAYVTDATGKPLTEWPNPYTFVPVVWLKHNELVGQRFGANAFHTAWGKIDELNDQASKANDYMRRLLDPPFYAAGVNGPEELEMKESGNDRARLPVIYGPADTSMIPLVTQIDLASVQANVAAQLEELTRDYPELALPDIRKQGQMTAPGVRAGFADAIARMVEARGRYDDALIRLNQMGISIAAYHGYEGFEAFSLESYAAGALAHSVAASSIIEDTLTLKERVDALVASAAPAWLIWRMIGGISDDDINKAWADKVNQDMQVAGAFGAAAVNGLSGVTE